MKLKLLSDYIDFYDHRFESRDSDAQIFHRVAATPNGYSKRRQFELMHNLFWKIPFIGSPREVADNEFQKDEAIHLIVNYTDVFLHAGNGKELVDTRHTNAFPSRGGFACEFVPSHHKWREGYSTSYRYQYIGDHLFTMRIDAKGDWRTNCAGESEVTITDQTEIIKQEFSALYAVDTVVDHRDGEEYAIDLNLAPSLQSTGIKDIMSAVDIVNELTNWVIKYGSQHNGHKPAMHP